MKGRLHVLAVLLTVLGVGFPASAQNYTVTVSGGAAITPGVTDIGNHCDDCVTSGVALPFPYTFYGTVFNTMTVSSNGNIQFVSTSNQLGGCLPDAAFDMAAFAHYDDLRTDAPGSGIFTSTSGLTPNRVFNLEWRSTYYSGAGAVTFEIQLFEGQERVDFVYGAGSNSSSATVGVQEGTGVQFVQSFCLVAGIAPGDRYSFTRGIGNTPPTITQLGPIARNQGQGAVVGIATVSDVQDAPGTLTVTAAPPAGITVTGITNVAGAITANVTASCTATVGANTVVLTVTDSGGLQATANLVVNVAATVITLSPATLPASVLLTPYSQTITASGGTGPYTFAVTVGVLPPGLTLTPAGLLSGTTTAPGTFNFTITATDLNGCTGSQAYSVVVANTPPTIAQLGPIARNQGQGGVVGIATVSDVQDAAGTLTVTAAPPAGITVTGITNTAGAITANVTASCAATVGANTVVLTVTDSGGLQATANLVVNVAATVIVVSPASLPLPVVLTPYSQTITASGGTGPYTFAVTAGALPPGLTLTPAGLLSGTPTTVGAFNFTITATDFNGCTGSRAYGTTTQKISATVVLSSAPNASKPGESVTFKATIVSPVATAPPSGPVQFRDGATLLGSGTLNLLGIATFSTSTLGVGTHPITASYPGDGFYDVAQSAILNQVVSPLVTTNTTLTSSVNPSNVGQSTTFTATVSPSSATGTVTFKDGSTTLGTGTMAGGIATYATSALTAGSHSITAVYGGDASNAGSTSSTLPQTVNLLATTTSVASSKNPSLVGASITFTATVAPAAATGTVTFKDGATTLGTGTLSGGTAALSTSALAVGIHPITVVYGGDASYATSTSSSLSQSITNVGGCTSGGTDTLCVQSNGRFTVKVAWTNQYNGNQTGVGTATAVTSDSGFFTFFSANNIELVIKVLDGRSVNGKYWVLYGALSDVGYTITVTDTQTSLVKTYVNAPGNLASVSDTGAFAGRPEEAQEALTDGPATYGQLASLQMVETAKLIDESTGGRAQLADDGACTTSGGTLCLNGGRFQLTAAWKNYNDASTGTGTAIALTSDSGYFWFFSSPNVELMLKVLDGRSVNGKFWYLSGALTDVEYTVTVTDTTTGTVKTYVNPAHTLKSLIDISAF